MWILASLSQIHQSWLGHGATELMAAVWRPFENLGRYFSLKDENDRLASENAQLYEDLHKALNAPYDEDNDMWRTKGFSFEFLPASVVSKSRNTQHNYIIIDRGWSDGVQEGDGVITPKGVVGIIQSAGENFSSAIMITNDNLSISARLGREGFVGNLAWTGQGPDKAVLSGIPLHVSFEPGDTVYTSGHSSVFPADIPVAIAQESRVHGGSSAEIETRFLEALDRVRHVMVVKNNDREELEELLK